MRLGREVGHVVAALPAGEFGPANAGVTVNGVAGTSTWAQPKFQQSDRAGVHIIDRDH